MKLFKTITLATLLTTASFGFDYKLNPIKITDGVYCFFGKLEVPNKIDNGDMVNTCYIDNGDTYTLIDSGPTKLYATQAYDAMKKIKNLPVKYVFNTHTHDDHINGNDFYASTGATIIGSSKMDEQLDDTRMKVSIQEIAFKGTVTYMPDLKIKKDKKVFGDIEAISLSKQGHTTSDLVYLDKKHQVLFVGDLVFNGRIGSMRDGDINGWIEALDKIDSIDFKYMVSGHGFDTSQTAHMITKEYFTLVRSAVKKAIEDEVEIDDAAKLIKLSKFENQALYNELHSKNVFKAYQLLEWE